MGSTIFLAFLKIGVAYLSGSVAVFSEGVHSLLDLISAAIAFYTIRAAGKPADEDHPFGHGKFETISSLLESLLLVAAAIWIIFEGVIHFLNPQDIKHHGLAILTMVFSLGISFFIYQQNLEASKKTESSAIRVNALHFLTDTMASGGVLFALILIHFTGWNILDPLIAFFVAAYILTLSVRQIQMALLELTDTVLPEDELKKIYTMLRGFDDKIIGLHDLRSRKSGITRHIDFHLVLCGLLSVRSSHAVCDEIEDSILKFFPNASVNIHVEPCEPKNRKCQTVCEFQKQEFEKEPGKRA